ncbi:MAG: PLDc N-terminal domain-containing protein [Candidatus Micrarchaeota archaeon]
MGGDIGGLVVLFSFLMFGLSGIGCFVAWVAGLAEVLTSKQSGLNKILWVIGMFILGSLGTLIYYFAGRKELTN